MVAWIDSRPPLERRLQLALRDHDPRSCSSGPARAGLGWEVLVYPPGALREWAYQARVSLPGEVPLLRLRLDPAPAADLAAGGAQPRRRLPGGAGLRPLPLRRARGAEPELARRTDTVVRYPDRCATPGTKGTHGIAGALRRRPPGGFAALDRRPRPSGSSSGRCGRSCSPASAWLMVVSCWRARPPFLKRYHEGEIGVRRGRADLPARGWLRPPAHLLHPARPLRASASGSSRASRPPGFGGCSR